MLTRQLLPSLDCPFVQSIGRYNGGHGTSHRQQNDDLDHDIRICAQPIEEGALRDTERMATFCADAALVLLAVDLDVAAAPFAFCNTVQIETKQLLWVHGFTSLASKPGDIVPMNPFPSSFYGCTTL